MHGPIGSACHSAMGAPDAKPHLLSVMIAAFEYFMARRAAIVSASLTVSPGQKVGSAPDVEVRGHHAGFLAAERADRGPAHSSTCWS